MDPIEWLRHPTRLRILVSAERCFAERGFDGSTIDDVLAASGVSKSHLYYHFPAKDALLAGLVRLRTADLTAAVGSWPEVVHPYGLFLRVLVVERMLRPTLVAPAWAALQALVPPGLDPDGEIARVAWADPRE